MLLNPDHSSGALNIVLKSSATLHGWTYIKKTHEKTLDVLSPKSHSQTSLNSEAFRSHAHITASQLQITTP